MSSPFSLFRRHQRVLMVVTTGLAMISFVLLGAIQDPRDMPMPLVVVFLAAIVGGIFWLAGLSRGKGADWGLTGVVIGVALGLAMIWAGREPNAVTMEGGDLKSSELNELMQNRQIANNFVQMAARAGIADNDESEAAQQALTEAAQRIQQNLFGFNRNREITSEDVVLGEVLRREATEMGMSISDDVVKKFITKISGGKLTGPEFSKIRKTLRVSETSLIEILREEILSQEAARLLSDPILSSQTPLTPQNDWNFFQKLHVKQTVELVSIPVSSFVSDSVKPTDEELQALLNQYNKNLPGFTPEGRPEEGRPGFYQMPKMELAYLEAVFDDIKATVGEVTDEEIQKRYEDEYLREVPESAPAGAMPSTGSSAIPAPALPVRPQTPEAATPAKSTEDSPSEKSDEKPAPAKEEAPPKEEPKKETTPEEPKSEAAPKEESKPEPAKETPEAPKEAAPKEETSSEPAGDEKSQSSIVTPLGKLQFVSLQDDEKKNEDPAPAETPAPAEEPEAKTPEAPAKEAPSAEAPAAKEADAKPAKSLEAPAKPKAEAEQPAETKKADEKKAEPAKEEKPKAEDSPAEEKTPAAGDKPAEAKPAEAKPEMKANPLGDDDLPPAPESNVPALDDTLKAELREDILRERTHAKITTLMDEAYEFVRDLSGKYRLGKIDENYVSLEEATKQIKKYAEENNLEFIETPFLTLNELQTSEDYPIGSAFVQSFAASRGLQTVVEQLQQSIPTMLFNVNQARRFNFGDFGASESRFVYWKTGFKEAYSPETIDDEPSVRQQVTKVWQQQQAAPAALKRAEALQKLLLKSDKPMTDALADETVTGDPDSLFLTVRETGEFTMLTEGAAQSTNPFQPQQPGMPRYSNIPGAEDVGERFFNKVFEDLNVEDVGVAPNRDGSAYYLVRIKTRTPDSPDEVNKLRSDFLNQGQQFAYLFLGEQLRNEYASNWARDLMKKYDVQFLANQRDSVSPEES